MNILRSICMVFLTCISLVCIAAALALLHQGLRQNHAPDGQPAPNAGCARANALVQSAQRIFDRIASEMPAAARASRDTSPRDSVLLRTYFAPCEPGSTGGAEAEFLAFLDTAQQSVYGAFYDLELQSVAEILAQKHRSGIDVRLVTDSRYAGRDALQYCVQAGIPVTLDDRSAFMHNKFCIVDGRYTWTGSTNVTENGFFRNDNNAVWIDSTALAGNYAAEFDEMFTAKLFGQNSPRNTPHPIVTAGSVRVECYFAPEDGVRAKILEELDAAESTIGFMAFSFTSSDIARAMIRRIESGVAVRGVVESRNAGSRYSQDDLLAAHGAEVHLDANPASMHNKVIIIDTEVLITGSYNFSNAAEEDNDENVLIIRDRELAGRYDSVLDSLCATAAAAHRPAS